MKLPKAETLILVAFLVCTLLWAVSKCSDRRADSARRVREIEGTETDERPVKRDTTTPVAPQKPSAELKTPVQTPGPPVAQPSPVEPGVAPKRPSLHPVSVAPPPATNKESGSTLFVTIDGLKVRKEPGLKGETLAELKLYEPVTFLNKKTEWTQEISLGYEKVTDHWVKVRTQSGKEGWVFGAGVHYYKMKRQGVLDLKKPVEDNKKKKENER